MIWSATLKTFFQSYSPYENITRTAQISQLSDAHVANSTFSLWRYKAIVTLSSRTFTHLYTCLVFSRSNLHRWASFAITDHVDTSNSSQVDTIVHPKRASSSPPSSTTNDMVISVGRRFLDMKKPFLFIPTLIAPYSYLSSVWQAIAVGGPFDCPTIIELVIRG